MNPGHAVKVWRLWSSDSDAETVAAVVMAAIAFGPIVYRQLTR